MGRYMMSGVDGLEDGDDLASMLLGGMTASHSLSREGSTNLLRLELKKTTETLPLDSKKSKGGIP